MDRDVYLDNTPLEEAQRGYLNILEERGLLKPLPEERVPVRESVGRITARGVFSKRSVPHYHSAAMDGIAVRAAETRGASHVAPLTLSVGEQAQPIDTGKPLPPGFDSVIKIEDVHFPEPDVVEITQSAAPWQYVRTIGEDTVAGELLLPTNHKIGPVDVGAMLACGLEEVAVRRRPRVVVIPTGSDLATAEGELTTGEIPEFNSAILGLTLEEWGAQWIKWPIVPDERESLAAAVTAAVKEGDLVLVNAGSSAGSQDYTAEVIGQLGQVHYHGVGIRPGKPVILGIIDGKPVLGIPGYPVSAHLTLHLFVRPLVNILQGQAEGTVPQRVSATLARRLVSQLGADEFVRVRLGQVEDELIALPLARGAGTLSSLVRADGVIKIPRLSQGLEEGSSVEVELLVPQDRIPGTILAAGSHDLILDLLADLLAQRYPGLRLASAHVGSTGGLQALAKKQTHVAGTHLLDEETGEYNLPYLHRLLPGQEVALINVVYRQQGLMVAQGNPRGIKDITDLTREDIVFVNRQRGAGTRILLDLKLKELGIEPGQITGYQREEFTHMGVAAAVASGVAHVGLGIFSAARAMGLDFIPLAEERYDLAVSRAFLESPTMEKLLTVITSADFRRMVEELGGYDLRDCGRLVGKTY
ncbi:MAG: molybdopterin biosynthesis protein [Limnochordia bacterium]